MAVKEDIPFLSARLSFFRSVSMFSPEFRGLTGAAVGQQGFLGTGQHTAARKNTLVVCAARRHSCEQFQAFGHMLRSVDMEQALVDGVNDLVVEHQVPTIAMRNQHALAAIQSGGGADSEIAFDLLIDAAYRQHLAVLVERTGHGDTLFERQAGQ